MTTTPKTIRERVRKHRIKTEKRFWKNVRITGDCWLWTGSMETSGYGRFNLRVLQNAKMVRLHSKAHRFSMFVHGRLKEIRSSKDKTNHIDHICKNRLCVNPRHLRVVSARTNALENNTSPPAINSKKKVCSNGHRFSGNNLIKRTRIGGGRHCRICQRKLQREWWRRFKSKNPNKWLRLKMKEESLKEGQ